MGSGERGIRLGAFYERLLICKEEIANAPSMSNLLAYAWYFRRLRRMGMPTL